MKSPLLHLLWLPLAASALAGCGGKAETPAAPAQPAFRNVRTATVQGGNAEATIRATGLLAPKDEIKLAFKTGGVIARTSVREGQAVRAGQLLATLNVAEIDAQVAQARIQVDKARRDLRRAEALQRDSVVTLAQLQDVRSALEAAEQQLRIAEFNRQYSQIVAPVSGRILRQLAEAGELVSPGAPVYLLGATSKGWVVRVGLSDREVVRVARGDAADVRLSAFPGQTYRARVTEIASAADPGSGTYAVELAIAPKGNERFVSGIVAQADLQPALQDPTSRIPVEALLQADGDQGSVFVLQPGNTPTVRRQSVRINRVEGATVVLANPLPAGTRVVTDGAAYLQNGDTVQVLDK